VDIPDVGQKGVIQDGVQRHYCVLVKIFFFFFFLLLF